MKKILVLTVCFFLTFAGININTVSAEQSMSCITIEPPSSYAYSLRFLIDNVWWTFYYEADGSLIVAIPDDDE